MKCYYHPDKDAIGVCVSCGKAVCIDCAVNISGKIHCKPCVEKIIPPKPQKPEVIVVPKPIRPASITLASILFIVFGVIGSIISIYSMVAGAVIISSIFPFEFLGRMVALFGLLMFVSSCLDIVAGYWLWHSLKKGGILGIIISVIGILFSLAIMLTSLGLSIVSIIADVILMIIYIIVYIILIILIAVGWDALR